MVKERERQTQNEDFMYLDSTSSFHRIFTDKHLLDVEKVAIRLRGECNAGTTHSNEKGWFKDLFHMWLVRNGIANLLSLPRLEGDGFRITYDMCTHWEIHCPDGNDFIFKKYVGVCKGFLYLDITKLQYHTKESENTQEAVSASHVDLVQKVRGDYEGFTDR